MFYMIQYIFSVNLFAFAVTLYMVIINMHGFIQQYSFYYQNSLEKLKISYDYIVVGSGTAGSTIAFRLGEDKESSVLVLEAGPYEPPFSEIPPLGINLHLTDLSWRYKTVPQKYSCKAMENQESSWPMGRIFGGTARMNMMIYLRGHKDDFKEWYKNKPDYNYNIDVLPYFKKSENQLGQNQNDDKYHSIGGPMNVNDPIFTTFLADTVIKAAEILGYPITDLNGESFSGFMIPQVNIKNSQRWTNADALLQYPNPNLHILTNAEVTKIIFKKNNIANGLFFNHLGLKRKVYAKKAIILSAGAIGTPKLLMLSGIGLKEHLQKIGIKVRKDLPVGNNLQDHITTGLDLITLNETLPINIPSILSPITFIKYFIQGKGPLAHTGAEVIAIPKDIHNKNIPQLQLMVLPYGLVIDGGTYLRKCVSVTDDVWNKYFVPLIGTQTISIIPVLLHPRSKGTIRLNNSNPKSSPLIDPNYLSDKKDVDILLHGIKLIKKIISTDPMQKLGARLNSNIFPGCENYEFDTEHYWECYLRQFTLTSYHPAGTCKMADEKDQTAVVDYNFKVIGIDRLYIADASVMPTLPSANINAAIAMIAEKLSDHLKYIQHLNKSQSNIKDIFLSENICVLENINVNLKLA